jgi:hypothetical protein
MFHMWFLRRRLGCWAPRAPDSDVLFRKRDIVGGEREELEWDDGVEVVFGYV